MPTGGDCSNPPQRKAAQAVFAAGIAKLFDQFRGVGHRKGRTVDQKDRPLLIKELARGQPLQASDTVLEEFRPKRLRESGSSLAPGGIGRRLFDSIIRDGQVGQHSANGLVGIQGAMDHRPDRHRWREDSISPRVPQVLADDLDLAVA